MCLPWESFSQKLRLSTDPHNCIEPNPLHPPILASECITKWLTPYGIAKLDSLILKFPIDIIHCCHCLINSVQPLMLSNYSAGLYASTNSAMTMACPKTTTCQHLKPFYPFSLQHMVQVLLVKA